MNNLIIVSACMLLAALSEFPPVKMEKYRPVKPEESERLLKQIFDRSVPVYKKFRGVETLRKEIVKEYNPVTNELKSTSEITVRRKDFFYEKPEIEVLSYRKDGKELKPASLRNYKGKPAYPMFDERGREHYDLIIAEKKIIEGKDCYRVQVSPKQQTPQHFSGNVYFTVNGLDPVFMEGTLAKLEFPLKEFRLEMKLFLAGGAPAARSGMLNIRLNVPVFYPDTRIISTFTGIESKPIE